MCTKFKAIPMLLAVQRLTKPATRNTERRNDVVTTSLQRKQHCHDVVCHRHFYTCHDVNHIVTTFCITREIKSECSAKTQNFFNVLLPIFKSGSRQDPSNFQPVSLTSIPCKLLEGTVQDRVEEHLTATRLLNNAWHGFLPKRSCAT